MARKKAKQSIEIDPRDPERELWLWALAASQQAPELRAKHSLIARTTRSPEYWEEHGALVAGNHREIREAWLADQEMLDRPEQA
jgi:lipoprotein NlpI